ncbi:hypothetical protein AB6G20_10300 [Providencia hangzhouensis]|uniref:hypothetical protein n=1 Tax=Providencia hangzhouensis TaxID=3031799 RepID=UPI0034DCED69
MRKLFVGLMAVSVMMIASINTANARNYPCSGSKGEDIAVKMVNLFVMMVQQVAQSKCVP